jgi:hypothetical protein
LFQFSEAAPVIGLSIEKSSAIAISQPSTICSSSIRNPVVPSTTQICGIADEIE